MATIHDMAAHYTNTLVSNNSEGGKGDNAYAIVLDQPVEIVAAALGITIQQAYIIRLLVQYPIVPRLTLEDSVPYAAVAVGRLKMRLASDKGIIIQSRYGIGYFLSAAAKTTIATRVAEFVHSETV